MSGTLHRAGGRRRDRVHLCVPDAASITGADCRIDRGNSAIR
jgi:hypothetical protein